MKYLIVAIITLSISGLGAADDSSSRLFAPDNLYNQLEESYRYWDEKARGMDQPLYNLKLAGSLLRLYSVDADLDNLIEAEQLVDNYLNTYSTVLSSASAYRMRAQIRIKEHRFCDALDDLLIAESMGESLRQTRALLFDVYFELADYQEAVKYLRYLSLEQDFDYLVRQARMDDADGNLESAIERIEASRKLVASNDWHKQAWISSNLADFYGHAGEIEKSRSLFKAALELNPADWYSIKGLAWISYAHDDQPEKALSLLKAVDQKYDIPQVQMLKYEIHTYLGNSEKADALRKSIIQSMTSDRYLTTYASYLFDICDSKNQAQLLKKIVDLESNQGMGHGRYVRKALWLDWNGRNAEAARTIEKHVLNQTEEPAILLASAKILGQRHPAYNTLINAVKEAFFELGPLATMEI